VQFNPLPLVQWDIDLIEHLLPENLPRKQVVKEILGFILQGLESDDYTTLPAWNPIIVEQHVIVSGFGTVAAFSLADGSLLWKSSTSDRVLEYLQSEELLTKLLGDASQNLLDYKQYLLQQLVADVTTGTLSSDGEYVFAVRECGVVNASRSQGFMQTVNELSAVPGYANRLCAFDVQSGRIQWEVGGLYGGKNQDYSGHYFLGPPVVIDKKVYLLSENGGQMVISQLSPQTGKALWMQPLAIPESEIISDRPRRLAGSSPAFCDPFLICATNSGTVVAIDLTARELSWLYTYIEKPVEKNNAFTQFGRQQRRGATGPKSVNFLSGSRWQDSVPLVAGNSILFTPVDSNDLFCLDVLTGKLLWSEHRQDGMFIEVDDQENVLIVGKHKMRSLKLADGTLNWEAAMSQSPASGRGVLRGDVYQLPTVRDGLHTFDLASGSLLATTEEALSWQHPETGTATAFRAGNLTVSADQLITLRNGRLIALQPLHQAIDQIEKKLLNNPQDDQALSITGQLALHRGDLQAGLNLLQQSYRIKQSPETARQITKTLLNANTDQIVLNDKDIEELAQMMVAAEHSTEIVFRYVRALQQHHKPVEALNVLRTLLASQQKSREYVSISAERRVRADALAAGAMKEVYASANQQQQQILREESLRLFEQAADANQLAALQPFAFDKQLSEQFRLAIVRKLDEMKSPLQLERHLLWLRLNGQGNHQAEATARLARLMLHHKKTTEAAGYLAELAAVYSETVCLDQQTGKQLLENWQLKYEGLNKKENGNLQGLVLNSEYDVSTIENDSTGNRYQAAPKLEVKSYHPSGSTWQYWDFHISRAIPMLVAQSPDKATQWRVSLEGKQLERIQNFSLHSQGHFALLCSDRGFIGMSGFDPPIDLKQPEVEDRHLLWDKTFSSHPGSSESQQSALLPTVAHEIIGPTPLMKSWAEEVGQLAPCYDHKLVYRLGTKIYLREADSGELLWEHQTRSSIPVLVWTDGKAVYKINNQTRSISQLRLEDGNPIGKLDHFPQHDDLLAFQGSIAVLRHNLNPEQGFLIGYHLEEQRTAWRIEISATTSLTSAGNGMLALFDVGKQKLMILDPTLSNPEVCQVDSPHGLASDLFVVSDPASWYIHFNNDPKTSIQPLVFQSKQNINGPMIAISKLTNKTIWSSKLDQLRWLPLQPAGLPFLMYGALVIEQTVDENGEQQRNYAPQLQVIHKGTGKSIIKMPKGIFGQLISADNNFQSKEFKLQFTKKTMIIKQKQP
ncbi:MAG: PQQ-binding-like beta-propeller repeat protein, partial [Planctomycetaceae bacterium]|nr:PQQ-binding-like beta-propeller repeat protein [Planctomycetaceae bacterium]